MVKPAAAASKPGTTYVPKTTSSPPPENDVTTTTKTAKAAASALSTPNTSTSTSADPALHTAATNSPPPQVISCTELEATLMSNASSYQASGSKDSRVWMQVLPLTASTQAPETPSLIEEAEQLYVKLDQYQQYFEEIQAKQKEWGKNPIDLSPSGEDEVSITDPSTQTAQAIWLDRIKPSLEERLTYYEKMRVHRETMKNEWGTIKERLNSAINANPSLYEKMQHVLAVYNVLKKDCQATISKYNEHANQINKMIAYLDTARNLEEQYPKELLNLKSLLEPISKNYCYAIDPSYTAYFGNLATSAAALITQAAKQRTPYVDRVLDQMGLRQNQPTADDHKDN